MVWTDEIFHLWRFNETSGDVIDYIRGFNLTVSGATPSGDYYYFDGINDCCYAPEENYGNNFSLFFLIKFDSVAAEKAIMGNGRKGATYGSFSFFVFNNGQLRVQADTSTDDSNSYATDIACISANQWYRIGFTREAGQAPKIYVNGKEIPGSSTSSNWTGTIDYGSDLLYIGGYDNAGSLSLPMAGYIDEIITWKRALTAEEVRDIKFKGEGEINMDGSIIGPTGGIGSRALSKDYPVEEGLIPGTTKTTGRVINLIPSEGSIVTSKDRFT